MKIVKSKKSKKETKHVITLRLSKTTIENAGRIAHNNDISRQRLLESIVEQAINDKNFVLKI